MPAPGPGVIPLALDTVAQLAPGRLDRARWTDEITGVQVDSRRIEEGDLFVAIGDNVSRPVSHVCDVSVPSCSHAGCSAATQTSSPMVTSDASGTYKR